MTGVLRYLSLWLSLVMVGGVGVAYGLAPSSSSTTLVFGLSSEPPNLDPAINNGTAARTVKLQIYRGLFTFSGDGKAEKELVASYDHPNPITFVFHLRPNLKFSDGSPLTADDVVFTLERIADPKVGAYIKKRLSIIQSAQALDPTTVKVTLAEPNAAFLDILAIPEAVVVSKRFTLAHDGNLKNDGLGPGPYMLRQWQHGVQITVERNPYYYRSGNPKTPAIRFVFYADDNSRVAALQSGAVDLIEYVPWQTISAIKASPQLGYQGTNGPFMYLIFNLTQAPFTDLRVRRAVGYAIDREAIIKTAFFDRGGIIYGLPVPGAVTFSTTKAAQQYTYDPDKAKKLQAEAGFPNGFTAALLSTAQYGMHKDTAQVVQQNLNAIGNHVTLSLPDWPTRVSQGNDARYQFAVMGTAGDYNDPDFLTAFFHSGPVNYASAPGYANPKMDRLLDDARATVNEARRKVLYSQIEQLALSESPYIFLTWREQGYAYKKGVAGFRNLPGFLTFNSGLTLEDTTITR